ncbi:MAG: hypothetical protein AAF281_03530 [Pseudomonadota bacterium]
MFKPFSSRSLWAASVLIGATVGPATATEPLQGRYLFVSCGVALEGPTTGAVDCRAETPKRNLRDLEFTAFEYLATWVEEAPEDLGREGYGFAFVAPVDPETGAVQVDLAAPMPFLAPSVRDYANGPEWALSQRGPEVFFTCNDAATAMPSLCRLSRFQTGDWQLSQVADSVGFMAKDPSRNPSDRVPKTHYEVRDSGPKIYGYRVDRTRNPRDVDIPLGLASGRWMSDGRRLLLTEMAPQSRNVVALDAETGVYTRFFDDGFSRSFAFPFAAPELNGDDAIAVKIDPVIGTVGADVAIYRPTDDGRWERWSTIPPICPDYPYTSSHEPFVVGDRSFMTFVSHAGDNGLVDPGVIWIATVDPDLPPERQVRQLVSPLSCGEDPINRRDPEALALINQDAARIYFLVAEIDVPDEFLDP